MVASKSSKEQTENKEEWDEARMIKYRKMKRKLVDFIAVTFSINTTRMNSN